MMFFVSYLWLYMCSMKLFVRY